MTTQLKPKEQAFVDETLANYGDYCVVLSLWVKKINPQGKVQSRLLVLGPFHVFSFKMGAFGKKSLQRCAHYFDLKEIATPKSQHIDLQFRDFNLKFTCKEVLQVVRVVHGIFCGLHPNFPEHYLAPLVKNIDKQIKSSLTSDAPDEVQRIVGEPGSLDNLWHVFCTWCNYYGLKNVKSSADAGGESAFLPDLKHYLEHKYATKNNILDNPPLTITLHFKALCRALRYNIYFSHIVLEQYSLREGNGLIASGAAVFSHDTSPMTPRTPRSPRVNDEDEEARETWDKVLESSLLELFAHTNAISHIRFCSLPLFESFFKKFGDIVKKRRHAATSGVSSSESNLTELPLQHIDLSTTKLDDKSMKQLAEILKVVSNSICSVNLSGCSLTPKGVTYLAEALIFATGAKLTYLNLSNNSLGSEGTTPLKDVISSGSYLHEVDLSNTNLDVAEICRFVRAKGCAVRHLNISRNIISIDVSEELLTLALNATNLKRLNLSDTQVPALMLPKLMASFAKNTQLRGLCLDVSGNEDYEKHVEAIISQLVINEVCSVEHLIMDRCGLNDVGVQTLFLALLSHDPDKLTLKTLSLSGNLIAPSESNRQERTRTAEVINKFLASNPHLENLIIRGQGSDDHASIAKSRVEMCFGPLLKEALTALCDEKNKKLSELDITGNRMGNEGANILKGILSRQTLSQLSCDGNQLTSATYKELSEIAEASQTLTFLSVPDIDLCGVPDSVHKQALLDKMTQFNLRRKGKESNR